MKSTYFFIQDTLSRVQADSVILSSGQEDSAETVKQFSSEEVEDIFQAMERKERQLDSIARVRASNAYRRSLEQEVPESFDTASVPYNYGQDSLVSDRNPLGQLHRQFYSSKDTAKPVFLENAPAGTTHAKVETMVPLPVHRPAYIHDLRPDWLLAIIIGSLVLLAWLKLFYNKFFDQTLQSLTNYQLSTKLLRDQNIFSRRVALTLNINFILIGAAFFYLALGFFRIRVFPFNDFLSYLSYAGIMAGLLFLRFIVSHIIGHVFRIHHEFMEYLHQLLLIYKNLGIYLLVCVFGIAYIREDLRIYLVYLSLLLVIAAFVFRLIKGMKIILSKKDVLIFYLILYLCTLEIIPVLIFYRFFSSSALAG